MALGGGALKRAVLGCDDGEEVVERGHQLLVPSADLPELHDAEVHEEGLELWLKHVLYFVSLKVVELKPEGHYLVVKMRTWLQKLNV